MYSFDFVIVILGDISVCSFAGVELVGTIISRSSHVSRKKVNGELTTRCYVDRGCELDFLFDSRVEPHPVCFTVFKRSTVL